MCNLYFFGHDENDLHEGLFIESAFIYCVILIMKHQIVDSFSVNDR